jgi:hypothetical protein
MSQKSQAIKSAPFFSSFREGRFGKSLPKLGPHKLDPMSFIMPEESEKTAELPTDLGVLKVHLD